MTNLNVSLRQIRAFVALAEHTSFRRAGEALGVAQSSLSATIQQIEGELGISLFDRTTRRVELTAVGRNLLPTFERLLNDVNFALEDAQAEVGGIRGRVVISSPLSVVMNILPIVTSRFLVRYPGARVTILDHGHRASQRSLQQNEADIAICGRDGIDDELDFRLLSVDQFHAVLPPDHPLAAKAEVTWASLLSEPFIAMARGTQIRDLMETIIQRSKLGFRPVCELHNPMAVEAMVRSGLGVSALPSATITSQVVSRSLVEPILQREIGLVVRRGRSLSPVADAYRTELLEYFKVP